MTEKNATHFFDAIAGRYDRTYALSSHESRRRLARMTRELPRPPALVLDLGVGTGRELSTLQDDGYTPTGVDVSGEMLARCARRSRPVPLVQADFWQPLPFSSASFDAAIALHGTCAHAPDNDTMARLAREVARVVRPEGIWIIEAPAPVWLEHVETSPALSGERRLRRTGLRTCVYEDLVVGASIEARVLDDDEWRQALGEAWIAQVEPLGEFEWLVVAKRAPSGGLLG